MLKDKKIICGRYWNSEGFAAAIVAVINKGRDWAAYIGATDGWISEETTEILIADKGCKLSEKDARHFFPKVKEPYRL